MSRASPTQPTADGRVWIAILIGAALAVALAVAAGLLAPPPGRLMKDARQTAAEGARRLFRPIRPQLPQRQVDDQVRPAAAAQN